MDALVIGIGNDMRGDDGAGPRVAADLAAAGYRTLVHGVLSEVALLGGDPVEAQQDLDLARSLRHTAAAERMLAGLEARLRMPPPEAG